MPSYPSSKNKLGLWTSTSLVIGNMIGAGVFLMPSAMASFGSISLLGWVFAAIGAYFLARVFSNLSKLLPQVSGGPYAYTRSGFGDFAGFLVAWCYWIAVSCANAAITISLVSALTAFIPALGSSATASIFTGLAAIWLLTWINTQGILVSGKLQLATTVLKILPLLVIAIGGLFFIRFDNYSPFNNSGTSIPTAINATVTLAMFAFVGIESAAIPAADVEDANKTVSKATVIGLGIATLIYLLGSVSIMGIIPIQKLAQSATPYADAAEIMFGKAARYWVSAGIAIAAFGALNGWILIQGQIPRSIAKDKLFPAIFARENKRNVPYVGMLINSIMVSVFMAMNYTKGLVDQFRFLMLLSIFTVFVPYLLTMASYIIIRAKQNIKTGWAGAVLLAVLAFAYCLWGIIGAGELTVFYGFLFMAAGIPVYVWIKLANKTDN